MNKLISLFVTTLLLTSCNQKSEDVSTEKESTNSNISVENTKTEGVANVNTGVIENNGGILDEVKEQEMKKARDSIRVNDLKQLQSAIEMYYSDKSKLPDKLKLEEELSSYLPNFRKEPLGNITKDGCDFGYIYEILDEAKGKYKISTCLEDKKSLSENDGGSYNNKFEVGNFGENQ